MKNVSLVLIFLFLLSLTVAAQNAELKIVPQPTSLTMSEGEFVFNKKTKIVATDEIGQKTAGILNDLLLKNYGFKLKLTKKSQSKNAIVFVPQVAAPLAAREANYALAITPDRIKITGRETGMSNALKTLIQILPADFNGEAKIPALDIVDRPER